MSACLMLTKDLDDQIADLEAVGCDIDRDDDAGTVDVRDADQLVLTAIQKGNSMQPWIVRFIESDRIKWKTKENT
jgi:hypothetical protein